MSLLSEIYDKIREQQTRDYQFELVGSPGAKIEPNEHYVEVRMLSARLPKVRSWGSYYYGAVHSFCKVIDITEGQVEYEQVSTPSKLAALDNDLQDKVIPINKTLLDQVPYLGRLAIQAGLFSVKSSDMVGGFLKIANQISETAGVAFLKVAQPFLPIVQNTADFLLGTGKNAQIEIGVDIELPLMGKDLAAGTYVLLHATREQLDAKKLRVDETDYRLLDANGKTVKEYAYLVLGINGSKTRTNWELSPELRDAWKAIAAAIRARDRAKARDLLDAFHYVCIACPDLVPAQAEELWQAAIRKFGLEPAVSKTLMAHDGGFIMEDPGELRDLGSF